MHEYRQPELFGLGEDPAEPLGGQVLAGDVGGDLDAAQPERSVQPLEFGDRQLGRLERHRAQPDEAIRMAADDVGDVVVDRARGGDAEIGRRVVIGLVRRGRERLDVDPHHVHVGQPLLHRGELHARPFSLLPVDLARARVGEHVARPALHLTGGAEHRLGRLGQHVAMDIDREVLAARMRRAGEPAWNARIGWETTEQHLCEPFLDESA